MKICHTEAMKLIKELEQQKSVVLRKEADNYSISYKEGEEKLKTDYSYLETRKEIASLDKQIRTLKTLLAIANTKVIIDDFNITIGEALVYLAQLQKEKSELEYLGSKQQLTRRSTPNGVIEYTECVYDVNKVNEDILVIRKKINDLQIAIDRANLTSYIEY